MAATVARQSAMTAALLSATGIVRRFGAVDVVDRIDMHVHQGEIVGVIGPNGAGKTTLLECLAGLQPLDGGELRYAGLLADSQTRRESIAYLPDVIAPWAEHPVGHTLRLYRDLYGVSQKCCADLIARLALVDVLPVSARALSKGYRRRFLLALALLTPQPLLLLDEPFDGLDLRQTVAVMALLREQTPGRSLVLSIHQLIDAERICDRLLLLDHGKCAGAGSLAELRSRAALPAGSLEEIFLALTA
jgi:ABC-2 type transport system ATP-binding protein